MVQAQVTVIDALIGRTLVRVEKREDTELVFTDSDGTQYTFCHDQDCCENVTINDIVGDLSDLIGSPILMAEVVSSQSDVDFGSETWTFYKFATVKGYVDVKWFGESNGYYSEDVHLHITPAPTTPAPPPTQELPAKTVEVIHINGGLYIEYTPEIARILSNQ